MSKKVWQGFFYTKSAHYISVHHQQTETTLKWGRGYLEL